MEKADCFLLSPLPAQAILRKNSWVLAPTSFRCLPLQHNHFQQLPVKEKKGIRGGGGGIGRKKSKNHFFFARFSAVLMELCWHCWHGAGLTSAS